MPSSLHKAYVSLADVLFDLLSNSELPDSIRSAIFDFSINLRAHLDSEQRKTLDVQELHVLLPLCLESLTDFQSSNNKQLEVVNGRLPAQVGK